MAMQPTQAPHARVAPAHPAQVLKHPHPLLAVLGWELRRALGSRATWIVAVLVFGVSLLLLRISRQSEDFGLAEHTSAGQLIHSVTSAIPWTTPFGLAILLPFSALVFGLFVPFVTVDGVSLDLKRRTHELLMTTALPGWAYVWGRYLAGVLLSVGLACVFLLAIIVMALALHIAQPNTYPLLDLPSALAIWAVIVLPPTVLLSSLSFALGTLLTRRSNLIKVAILFAWFVCGNLLPGYLQQQANQTRGFAQGHTPAWYSAYLAWDPTYIAAGEGIVGGQFFGLIDPIVRNASLSDHAVLQRVRLVEQQMPDLSTLIGPHLAWVAVGLAAVALTAMSFRRFRNVVA